MTFTKKFLKNERTLKAISWLLAAYIRLAYATGRKRIDADPAALPYVRGDANAIFAFWHGRMMLMSCVCPPSRKMRILISHHRDGKLISHTIGRFGQQTVSGSTSKGGVEAAAEILRALENGDNIGITPDGPRGPTQIATKGIIALARLAQKPIVPATFSSSLATHLNSWDRFLLALPFGRIVYCVGAPIMVAENSDEETMRAAFEQAMNQLIEQADEAVRG